MIVQTANRYFVFTFLLIIAAVLCSSKLSAQNILRIPALSAAGSDTISVPVIMSSDSAIAFIQLTIDYNSSELQPMTPFIVPGKDAGNLTIALINRNLPFSPLNPGADTNVLVQLSGGGVNSITGDSLEILLLNFAVTATAGDTLGLWFDGTIGRTLLTTLNAQDIEGADLTLQNGKVIVDSSVTTSVADGQTQDIPANPVLLPNYPNPFNPSTTIAYELPQAQNVTLKIYDLTGREVATLLENERMSSGSHSAVFDAGGLASGLYYYRIIVGDWTQTRKMVLLR